MKRRTTKLLVAALVGAALAGGLTACASDSDVASQNISTDAEYFKIERQIVFYNSITDKYIATVEGKCSVDAADISNTLAVTCKVGKNKYIKDYFRNADNVTWFELQAKAVAESVYRYKVVFKPESVIPDLHLSSSVTDGK
jgi:hypothetical protein